ncbi:hypothetical protein GC175_23180 [bacterium]|nr:hypothetical protein [bacterium]
MSGSKQLLTDVFDGWGGFQRSMIQAVGPLTSEQLLWRPEAKLRSVGELARHLSFGRIEWFARMDAPGSADLASQIAHWQQDGDSNRHIIEGAIAIDDRAEELVHWLDLS